MKVCPQCAEEVQDEAKVCRFCQWRFDPTRLGYVAGGFIALFVFLMIGQTCGSS